MAKKTVAELFHETAKAEAVTSGGGQVLIDVIQHSLFEKQRELVEDDAAHPKRCACCGRRAGKTQAIIRKLFLKCLKRPRSVAVYFATTLASAKKLVWDQPYGIPALIQDLGLSGMCTVNETEHRVTFKNGSVLWIAGCDTMQDAKRWKGLYYDFACLDECQDWPDDILRYMIHEALAWALMDHRGELLLTGTPSPWFGGIFYEIATGVRQGWGVSHWTCFDNPHIPDPQAFIEAECRERGLELDDPIVQREFYGRWVRDTNTCLYSYMPGRNDFDQLPQEPNWRYVLGIDIGGTRDLTTYTLACYRNYDRCTYFLNSFGERNGPNTAPITRMSVIVETYRRRLGNALQVVGDFGSLGVNFQLELLNRFGLPADAAKKADKAGAIQLYNDQFRLGLVKLGKDCQELRAQLMTLQVDPKTRIERPGDACDYADSSLYAWKKTYSYLARPQEDQSAVAVRERMVRRVQEQHMREVRPPAEEVPVMGGYNDQL